MDQILAELHSNREEATNRVGKMDTSNPQNMEVVLQQRNRQPTKDQEEVIVPLPSSKNNQNKKFGNI